MFQIGDKVYCGYDAYPQTEVVIDNQGEYYILSGVVGGWGEDRKTPRFKKLLKSYVEECYIVLPSDKISIDINVIGFKTITIIGQQVTDSNTSEDNTKWCDYRVQLDTTKPIVLDLGNGRQIQIVFNANKTDI